MDSHPLDFSGLHQTGPLCPLLTEWPADGPPVWLLSRSKHTEFQSLWTRSQHSFSKKTSLSSNLTQFLECFRLFKSKFAATALQILPRESANVFRAWAWLAQASAYSGLQERGLPPGHCGFMRWWWLLMIFLNAFRTIKNRLLFP